MNKPGVALLAGFAVSAVLSAHAADAVKPEASTCMGDIKKMDSNSDGLISKEEFMQHYEAIFDAIKKDKKGKVDYLQMMSAGFQKDCSRAKMKART